MELICISLSTLIASTQDLIVVPHTMLSSGSPTSTIWRLTRRENTIMLKIMMLLMNHQTPKQTGENIRNISNANSMMMRNTFMRSMMLRLITTTKRKVLLTTGKMTVKLLTIVKRLSTRIATTILIVEFTVMSKVSLTDTMKSPHGSLQRVLITTKDSTMRTLALPAIMVTISMCKSMTTIQRPTQRKNLPPAKNTFSSNMSTNFLNTKKTSLEDSMRPTNVMLSSVKNTHI